MRQTLRFMGLAAFAVLAAPAVASDGQPQGATQARSAIDAAVAAPTRSPDNVKRDAHRRPAETLAFFGVKPGDTVVEIWPGGGWFTEILAPLTAAKGTYYAAAPWTNGFRGVDALQTKDAATYGHIKKAAFPVTASDQPRVPDNSVDVVLTFRNVHNWKMAGDEQVSAAFAQMFAMLKPGGVLGIEDHRLPESADSAREKSSGYVKVSTVRAFAEAAGFKFAGASEVNANPRDTADWENGVWTLPPTYRLKDVDREKYAAIGESDRMTLKFVKP